MPSGNRVRHLPNGAPWGDPAKAPRCGARCRDGRACRQPAVRGRRVCRMHGGMGGAPKGVCRGVWDGRRTALRREIRAAVRYVHARARRLEALNCWQRTCLQAAKLGWPAPPPPELGPAPPFPTVSR
jgi:hypothetical protein